MTKSYQKELLDSDEIPENDLIQNLKELKFINTHLGGHAVIEKGLKMLGNSIANILEIGSGGGDNLIFLKNKHPNNQYNGLDIKEVCTKYATTQDDTISWILADYKNHKPKVKYDIIFNSLFCHHFNDADLVEMLVWMKRNAKQGFFIGDLHRHWLAYYSIKLLTVLFSKSYLVKNDAPLSVKRGFTRNEWKLLLAKAGIDQYQIRWCWAFRYLIVVKN